MYDKGLESQHENNCFQDSSNLDVACPLGQQLIGAIFGFLLGFLSLLLIGESRWIISLSVSFGTTFGTLASRVSNPIDVIFKEFCTVFAMAEFFCLMSFIFISCESMFGLLIVSFFVAIASSTIRSLFFMGYAPMKNDMAKLYGTVTV
jgi:hypothetical protein